MGLKYNVNIETEGAFTSAERKGFQNALMRYYKMRKITLLPFVMIFLLCFVFVIVDESEIGAFFFIFSPVGFVIRAVILRVSKINITYEQDEYSEKRVEFIDSMLEILQDIGNVWQMTELCDVTNKDRSGAIKSGDRNPAIIYRKQPKFLYTNVHCYIIALKNESLYILPDKLLVEKNKNIDVIDWKEIEFETDKMKLIEDVVPNDTESVEKTWKYVNNDGSRDKRYNDNYKRYLCKYGLLKLSSKKGEGFNITFLLSSVDKMKMLIDMLATYQQSYK